jgi:hypothetical protein
LAFFTGALIVRSFRELTFRGSQEIANLALWAVPPRPPVDAVQDRTHLPDPSQVVARLKGTEYADQTVRLAEEVLAHRVPLLDRVIETGDAIDWRRDYTCGRSSPLRYFKLVPYLDIAQVGDHKWIWELNRHQHLVLLAQAYCITKREQFSAEVFSQLESWISANPFMRGINWASALEVAFRALSWIWIDHLLGARMDPLLYRRFLATLTRHGAYLEANLSIYFAPNTHLLGEALALYAIGLFYPSLPQAGRWRRRGSDLMNAQLDVQVREDGSHFEQSSYYHLYALDMGLFFYVLAGRPEHLRPKLERMAEYLDALAGPARTLPFLGDDDGGRLFHPYGRRDTFARANLALCGVLFDRPEWITCTADLPEIAGWWLGTACLDLRKPVSKPRASRLFPQAGIASMESGDRHVLVDAGAFGAVGAGHSHSDTLSLVASEEQEEILVDAGSFTYVGDPDWRNWFRSSAAHNTLSVDGFDQADPAHAFRWLNPPEVNIRNWTSSPERDYLDATCSYRGFTHRRRVLFRKPDLVFVLDHIEGPAGEHRVEVFWHPGGRLTRLGPSCFQIGSRARLHLASPQGEIEFGENSGYGWRSRVFGEKQPAPYLCWRSRQSLPLTTAAVLDFSGRADSFTLASICSEFEAS